MSRTAWRALFATLRNNWYFVLFILFIAHLSVVACGIALDHPGKLVPFVIMWFVVAIGWPLMLCLVAPSREFLLLPLGTRDVGGVLFMLRVVVPSAALLLVAAVQLTLVRVTKGGFDMPGVPLWVALQACAAFPAMVLAPFLPLPAFFWRDRDPSYQNGRPAIRVAAAVAIWLVAPAIAFVPVFTRQSGMAYGGVLSLALGATLAALAWGLRERIVIESFWSGRAAAQDSALSCPRGWGGIAPLFVTNCILAAALGVMVPLMLLPWRHGLADRALAAGELAFAGSCTANAAMLALQKSIRPLRLLPISTGAMSTLLTLAVSLPPLVGLIVSFCVVGWFHPRLNVPLFHTAALWTFCMASALMAVPAAVRFGRSRAMALRSAPWSVLSWFVATGILATNLHLPRDTWLLAAAIISMCISYVWLRHTLATTLVRQVIPS